MKRFRFSNRVHPGRLVVLWFVLCGLHVPGYAAEKAAAEKLKVVEQLKKDIRFLASDELEGRGVGTGGLNVAADFIRKEFQKAGLDVTRVNKGAFHKFTMITGAKLGKKNSLTLIGP